MDKNKLIESVMQTAQCERKEAIGALRACDWYTDLAVKWLRASDTIEVDMIEEEAEDRWLQQEEADALVSE